MLFRPVYLKGSKMHECIVPKGPARAHTPPREPSPPAPEPVPEPEPEPDAPETEPPSHIPMLVCGVGVNSVFPKEATRDVMSGRVPYYLVDERGITLFEPKHIFAALKLDKEHVGRYEDYPCIGAHQRVLPRKPVPKRAGLGYRRRYIAPELIGRGIYGTNDTWNSSRSNQTMSLGALHKGFSGPRA